MSPPFLHPDATLVDECVHCGFCLAACPTYQLWSAEADSPRGRIYLLQQALEESPLTPSTVEHFDRCLGCMACVTACPSGVRYDQLILSTKSEIEAVHRRGWRERLLREFIFALFCHPERLSVFTNGLRWYQRSGLQAWLRRRGVIEALPKVLYAMESLAPRLSDKRRPLDTSYQADGVTRGRVVLLEGCVQSVLFAEVNHSSVNVLTAEGFDVEIPRGQGCCGALSLHAGRRDEAKRFARHLIDTLGPVEFDTLVINSAGCGSSVKEYGELLDDDPNYRDRAHELSAKARDIAEFLASIAPRAPRHRLDTRVAYHDACHLSHAQGITSAPRSLLASIPGVELVEIDGAELCCGSAGIYNLLQVDAAFGIGDAKARAVAATAADLLIAGNPGCLMQIDAALERSGQHLAVAHTIEVLEASIRGLDPAELTKR